MALFDLVAVVVAGDEGGLDVLGDEEGEELLEAPLYRHVKVLEMTPASASDCRPLQLTEGLEESNWTSPPTWRRLGRDKLQRIQY